MPPAKLERIDSVGLGVARLLWSRHLRWFGLPVACPGGGTGRHAVLRGRGATVWVRVPPWAPGQRGDVAKWLRRGSAKPLFGGSIPPVASTGPLAPHCRSHEANARIAARCAHRPRWRNGRRGGLKIRCPKGRVGSTPSLGTTSVTHSGATHPAKTRMAQSIGPSTQPRANGWGRSQFGRDGPPVAKWR